MLIRVVGVGAGGHARAVLETLRGNPDVQLCGLVDPNKALWNTEVLGVNVLGGDELLPKLLADGIRHAFIGVGSTGDSTHRRHVYQMVRSAGFEIIPVVHQTAFVAPSCSIGAGPTIMPGAIVHTLARLGDNVIVNSGAIVEHDCVIGDHCHIATGARLASSIYVGEGSHVGVGASIRETVRIGSNSIVGAGAVVIDDIPDNVIVAGVPARIIRQKANTQ